MRTTLTIAAWLVAVSIAQAQPETMSTVQPRNPLDLPRLARSQAVTCAALPDDTIIQNAISAAAASGGGTVQLAARVYDICQPVTLQNNIHLTGSGRGATVLRTSQGNAPGSLGASIIGVAVSNASVTDLTLDQRTNGRVANGIAFMVDQVTRAVPSNILIARTEVLGAPIPDGHQYLIWNYLGRHVKITDNWVDGGFYTGPLGIVSEEGIESYGGYDVLVHGNTVTGINGSCLNFGSGDNSPNPNSQLVGLMVDDNYAFYCFRGITLGTGTNPAQILAHATVRGNVIIYAAREGISVSVGDGTLVRDVNVSGNTIRNVGSSAGGSGNVSGIRLWLRSGTPTVVATTILGNHIDNVGGSPGFGIRLENYPHARIRENTITGTSSEGISVWGILGSSSDDTEIAGNRIELSGSYGIFSGTTNRAQIVTDNEITDWGASSDGIHLDGALYGAVRNNIFKRADLAQPPPLVIGMGSCGVAVGGNVALYKGTVNNSSPPACP